MVHINNKKKSQQQKKDKGKHAAGSSEVPGLNDSVMENTRIQNTMMHSRNISPSYFQKVPAYQKVTESYTKPKIMVCTPCYCGQVHVKYMESMLRLQLVLMKYNIGF